jgi:uncharacterized membrane protein
MPNPFAQPVHPMLVHFPIAMLTAAWVCVVVRYVTGDLRWDERTRLMEVIGVVALAPTLVAGIIDTRGLGFLTKPRFDQPVIWHVLAAVMAAGFFTAHFLWRRRRPEIFGRRLVAQDLGLATLGMSALLLAGMIGGEMVHGT